MMRMADADVIPFQFGDLADTIHVYDGELKKLADTERAQTKERNTEITEGVYKALVNPKKTMVPPRRRNCHHTSTLRRSIRLLTILRRRPRSTTRCSRPMQPAASQR